MLRLRAFASALLPTFQRGSALRPVGETAAKGHVFELARRDGQGILGVTQSLLGILVLVVFTLGISEFLSKPATQTTAGTSPEAS